MLALYTLVTAGSDIDIELWLGDNTTPVEKIYGLAFDIGFNNNLIQSNSVKFSIPSSFIGIQGTNAIRFSKVDEVNGKIYGAVSRTNHSNVDGFGKIATIKMKADSTISSSSNLQFSISKYEAIDSSGQIITLDAPTGSITIIPTGIYDIVNNSLVKIYPNPNNGKFTLETEGIPSNIGSEIRIYDLLGNEIYNQKLNTSKAEFDLSDQAKGIYFLKVYSRNGLVALRKIVLQ